MIVALISAIQGPQITDIRATILTERSTSQAAPAMHVAATNGDLHIGH
jgi:hypothetical protein